MFALGIRYLNGWVAASEPDAHDRAEWPPHPGRVFMALAAAHFQTGADPAERVALEWLEALNEPPAIRAGEHFERSGTDGSRSVQQFVPINDRPVWKKERPGQKPPPPLQAAPGLMRDRHGRSFPRAMLDDDRVYLSWPSAEPPQAVRGALEALCAKVTRIGHSSSFVQMWVADRDEAGDPTWVPDDQRGEMYLRIVAPGTLSELERLYNARAVERYAELAVAAYDDSDPNSQRVAKQRLEEEFGNQPPPQLRPRLSLYQGYARPVPTSDAPAAPGTVFSPYPLVLTLEREDPVRRHLDLPCVLALVHRWREAILTQSNGLPERIRSLLSGHEPGGAPLDRPHLAFMPLAFVGDQHADGRLLGMGLVFPAEVSREDRRLAVQAIATVRHLALGRLGRWKPSVDRRSSPPWNLQPAAWTAYPGGATHWSTVTPIVFDRHPKADAPADGYREVAAMIAVGCTRIGLPEPREVVVTHVSAHPGVPPAFAFPKLRRKDGSERRHMHAILVFDRPVCGPVLIGAGRYRGYGLARPIELGGRL